MKAYNKKTTSKKYFEWLTETEISDAHFEYELTMMFDHVIEKMGFINIEELYKFIVKHKDEELILSESEDDGTYVHELTIAGKQFTITGIVSIYE